MKTILVIHTGAIGDFVLALPAILALRRGLPAARIEILGRPSIARLALDGTHADAVHDIELTSISTLFAPDKEIPDDLQAFLSRYDLALTFIDDEHGTLGANLRRAGCGAVHRCRTIPDVGSRVHAIDQALEAVARLGIELGEACRRPAIRPPGAWLDDAARFLGERSGSGGSVVVHPGSGSRRKNWSVEAFARVVDRLALEDARPAIVATGEAEQRGLASRLGRFVTGPTLSAHSLPLTTLAGILSQCRLYLGNDSGITHLAAAVGAPVVAIFGPTDPDVWGPRGERVRILRGTRLPGQAGISPEAPSPDDVLRACAELRRAGLHRA